MGKLEGRIAVVTGGARGIGSYITRAFADEGAKLCINYISDSSKVLAEELVEEIKAKGGDAFCYQCDMSKPDQVRGMFKTAADYFGGIDILVNNAGILFEDRLVDMEYEKIWRTLEVNLFGYFVGIKEAIPYLLKSKYPRIINNASQLAQKGDDGLAAYCASKSGIMGLTRAMATELSVHCMNTNILINTVAPGAITIGQEASDEYVSRLTAKLPLGRFVTPEEVTPCFVFFASDDCTGFIGQVMCPNSGDTMNY